VIHSYIYITLKSYDQKTNKKGTISAKKFLLVIKSTHKMWFWFK